MAVGIVAFDWRLGIAAFWPVPVAFADLRRGKQGGAPQGGGEGGTPALRMADGVQEYLDCAQEIRATEPGARFPAGVG